MVELKGSMEKFKWESSDAIYSGMMSFVQCTLKVSEEFINCTEGINKRMKQERLRERKRMDRSCWDAWDWMNYYSGGEKKNKSQIEYSCSALCCSVYLCWERRLTWNCASETEREFCRRNIVKPNQILLKYIKSA